MLLHVYSFVAWSSTGFDGDMRQGNTGYFTVPVRYVLAALHRCHAQCSILPQKVSRPRRPV
jgi:hypothetical protein